MLYHGLTIQSVSMKIKLSKKFKKQYFKSDIKIRKFFDERLRIFIKNQDERVLNNHYLTGKLRGYKSINITGDWRAIFYESDIDTITFVMFGTHSQLYG